MLVGEQDTSWHVLHNPCLEKIEFTSSFMTLHVLIESIFKSCTMHYNHFGIASLNLGRLDDQ